MRLLVLSDVHAGASNKNRTLVPSDDRPASDILDDSRIEAAIEIARARKPDAIVVPGDLTQKATIAQFRAALAFVGNLGTSLGVPPDCHIIVPGNHDTDWAAVTRFPQGTEESALRSAFRFSPAIEACRLSPTKLSGGTLAEPYFDIHHVGRTRFLTINTAAHDGPYEEVHHGAITPASVTAIRRDARWKDGDCDLRIAVIHHHLMNFTPGPPYDHSTLQNAEELIRAFEDLGIDFVVHGHQHAPRLAASTTGQRRIPTLGCGTFGGQPSPADPAITQVFHVVDIEAVPDPPPEGCTARGTVTTYGWTHGSGWRPAESRWIAAEDRFGTYADSPKVQRLIRDTMGERGLIRESQLRDASDALRWLHARDLRSGMAALAEKGDFAFVTDQATSERMLVKVT